MTEVPRRLAPEPDTVRRLFLHSGNLCAFPDCSQLMMNATGAFIGQMCHIEAALTGGERFNVDSSNEQRRQFSNLMLMCYPHHIETNDVTKFPVQKLLDMKATHEKRFADPSAAILSTLQDWTRSAQVTFAETLGRFKDALGFDLDEEDTADAIRELRVFVREFAKVPVKSRQFMGEVALRAYRMRKTNVVERSHGSTLILASDVADAFGIDERVVGEKARQLDAYKLAYITEMEIDFRPQGALRFCVLDSGWDFWFDLARFCQRTSVGMHLFTVDLDFKLLDS